MNYSDLIIFIMEMMGTVAFAASGAMLGIRKKMDLFGVCVPKRAFCLPRPGNRFFLMCLTFWPTAAN